MGAIFGGVLPVGQHYCVYQGAIPASFAPTNIVNVVNYRPVQKALDTTGVLTPATGDSFGSVPTLDVNGQSAFDVSYTQFENGAQRNITINGPNTYLPTLAGGLVPYGDEMFAYYPHENQGYLATFFNRRSDDLAIGGAFPLGRLRFLGFGLGHGPFYVNGDYLTSNTGNEFVVAYGPGLRAYAVAYLKSDGIPSNYIYPGRLVFFIPEASGGAYMSIIGSYNGQYYAPQISVPDFTTGHNHVLQLDFANVAQGQWSYSRWHIDPGAEDLSYDATREPMYFVGGPLAGAFLNQNPGGGSKQYLKPSMFGFIGQGLATGLDQDVYILSRECDRYWKIDVQSSFPFPDDFQRFSAVADLSGNLYLIDVDGTVWSTLGQIPSGSIPLYNGPLPGFRLPCLSPCIAANISHTHIVGGK